MVDKSFLARIALRRGLESDYLPSFVPLKGELCFVETEYEGVKAKVGNGNSTFSELPYIIDKQVKFGILSENTFYLDESHSAYYVLAGDALYIDSDTNKAYRYDDKKRELVCLNPDTTIASATDPGIVKLYNTKGSNVDGTITQRLFTEEINTKVSTSVKDDEELLILT